MISTTFKNLSRVCSSNNLSRASAEVCYTQITRVFKSSAYNEKSDSVTQKANAMRIICEKTYPQMSPAERKLVDDFQDIMLDQGCGLILPNTALDEIRAELNDLNEEERSSPKKL